MNRRPCRFRRRRGFTLMEILLVLAILVVLGSMVGVGYVQIQKNAYINTAKTQVTALEKAVNFYILDVGSAPPADTGLSALLTPPGELPDPTKWKGPYLEKQDLPVDPWNNPYVYELTGPGQFRISSWGPDGISGGTDDIMTTPQALGSM